MRTIFTTALLLFAAMPLFAQVIAPNGSKQLTNYRTSWIGNTYGGLNPETGKGQWVQQDIATMCVAADGTVYTNIPWEEGGGNCVMYKDGEMLGAAYHTHGWGSNGGKAVTVNDKYVFIACVCGNEGGKLTDPDTWPPKDKRWFGVSRRLRSDFTKEAPFEHGKGGKGDTLPKCFLVVNEVPDERKIDGPGAITGLWATPDRLYVTNPLENRIEIYDTETMLKLEQWSIPDQFKGKFGAIAMDPDGNLWMLLREPMPNQLHTGNGFLVFDPKGKLFTKPGATDDRFSHCPMEIPKGNTVNNIVPSHFSAFCFDNKGRLLVADAGMMQAIFIFEKSGQKYVPFQPDTPQSLIGLPMAQMSRGIHEEFVFCNISAIGCDASGNIYIASDWATSGGGTILESYAPIKEPPHWKRNWRLYGLCFIDCATLDPEEETMVYTKGERYKIDWSKEPGKESTLLGNTAFRPNAVFKTFPWADPEEGKSMFRDPRLNIGDSGSVWLRNFDGKKFLFVSDMNSDRLQVYSIDYERKGNPVRPAVLILPRHFKLRNGDEPVDWLPGQPEKGEWIWTNSSNTEKLFMKSEEFVSQEPEVSSIEGWCIEQKGDIWQTTFNKGLRRFRYQGLDKIGNPIWNFENLDTYPHPEEFTRVKRIRYYPETDTLYLGGWAMVDGVEHKPHHWKSMGAVICRYDNFLKGDRPGTTEGKLRWRTIVPYVASSSTYSSWCEPMGFDIAGDYMFVPYVGASKVSGFRSGHVEVIRTADASPVGWMEPDPKTVGDIGLQDIRECLSAHKLKSGEYVIFLEDDYKAKVVMYRWKPE